VERDRAAQQAREAREALVGGEAADKKAALAAMVARAQMTHEHVSAGVACVQQPPPVARAAPAALDPSDPSRPLSYDSWLRRELASEQLRKRLERPRVHEKPPLPREAAEWGPLKEKRSIEARAKVRPLIEGVSAAKECYRALCLDPTTAHFAIAIKRICDAKGWTLADLAARRALALLEFLRLLARPHCWNARHVRRPRRGLFSVGAVVASGAQRKYSPGVQAVAQPFLATVLAWPGHRPDDDRSVNRKTVGRVTALLDLAGVVQAIQVPAHAAESHELGDSGHAIHRYWLADRGSPKPALMAPFDAAGELVGVDILAAPWRGAVPAVPRSTAPP
jgi:hypothetical protein